LFCAPLAVHPSTRSLHDALPISTVAPRVYIGAGISGAPHHIGGMAGAGTVIAVNIDDEAPLVQLADFAVIGDLSSVLADAVEVRSEEHTSELQSRFDLVCRLLLE